jgi:hypothetical protein
MLFLGGKNIDFRGGGGINICFRPKYRPLSRYGAGTRTGTGTVTFSKVGIGTITFQMSEPEP